MRLEEHCENSCQQPMANDPQSEQQPAGAQPDLPGSEQNKHRPGTLTIQGMKQCQLLLSCMLRLTAHCLRRSPPLLASSSFMETLPSICNLASHGGIQVCLCARPVASHLFSLITKYLTLFWPRTSKMTWLSHITGFGILDEPVEKV